MVYVGQAYGTLRSCDFQEGAAHPLVLKLPSADRPHRGLRSIALPGKGPAGQAVGPAQGEPGIWVKSTPSRPAFMLSSEESKRKLTLQTGLSSLPTDAAQLNADGAR